MIVIVGGRISGCTTAALLAQQGEEVLLLERQHFPAPIVSAAVFFSDTMAVFDKIAFGSLLDSYNFPRITYISFEMSPGIRISGKIPYAHSRNWAYAIRRETLDTLLLNHIRTFPNIRVREGFNVTRLLWEDERVVGVQGRYEGGASEIIPAEIVIGADGKRSLIAKEANAPKYNVRIGRTCFYYAYYSNVTPYNDQVSLVTYYGSSSFCFHAFTQAAEAGLSAVGVEAPSSEFKHFQQDPEGMLTCCLRTIPELNTRLKQAKQETRVMGLQVPDMFYRKPYGLGWALVGDAGLFIDPITGQGLNDATASAVWLSKAIDRWRRGEAWGPALSHYQQTRDKMTKSNFERAYLATDFQSPLPNWMQRWYSWMSAKPSRSRAMLAMLSNIIPPEQFFTPWRMSLAYVRHELLHRLKSSH